MIASKLSPGSIFPTLSTKSNPLGFDVSGTAMRTAHEPSAALTVTAYAVPSPSLCQRTSRRGRCNPHVTNRCAIDSRVTENSSFSWRRSGAGLVCQGHHTVTLTMLTNRGEYTKAVQDVLAAKWRKIGLTVEQVSVQDVRYGEAITKKYTEAQAAEIDKQKALNEQQVAKTEAETKKIKAQGEADANAVLNESLTDNVLKQHYIDALSNADQLVVVPDGADTLVQTK